MNRVKYDVLRAALEKIGACQEANRTAELAHIARLALADADKAIEYRITARTWYGRSGGEWVAELRETDTGNIVFSASGSGGNSAWEYRMRDLMHERMPDVFPDPKGACATIYFRETCRVEYEHTEVARKRDL